MVDESVEGLCGVERGSGGGEGEVEGFGFDFGAGDGVGDYDLFDARGVGGGVRRDGGVGVVVGVEICDEDCGAAEAADEGYTSLLGLGSGNSVMMMEEETYQGRGLGPLGRLCR